MIATTQITARRTAAVFGAAALLLAMLLLALQLQRPAQAAPITPALKGGTCSRETAGTMFLKIGDIKGESTDDEHPEWMDLESFSWGMTQTGTVGGGGGGTGKVNVQDFHFTMKMNSGSPVLMQACASGEHIKKVELNVRRPEAKADYLQWTMEDVVCTSFQTSGSANGDAIPTEQVSLNFAKIKVEYTKQDKQCKPGEKSIFQWDVERNEVF